MSTKNFLLLISLSLCIYSSICAPNQQPTAVKEEILAANEENIDDTTTMKAISSETIKIQENEIDSEILRDDITVEEATTTTTSTIDVEEEEKSTESPLIPQKNHTANMNIAFMRKQLIEHFKKQLTTSVIRAMFLVLNELKRRQNMGYPQQQQQQESRIVESRILQHDGCECNCNTEANNCKDCGDENAAEVIIIDKTQNAKRRLKSKQKKLSKDVSAF